MEVAGYAVESRASKLIAEIVSVATFLVTLTLASATSSFTANQVLGVNMLRCGVFSVLQNGWRLLAAAYYAARQFGMNGELQTAINEFYPYLCTCKYEVAQLAPYFGGGDTSNFETCSSA